MRGFKWFLPGALIVAFSFSSEPVSAKGDVARGEELAKACRACHGKTGRSPSQAFPIIGGQHEKYLELALKAYKDGTRKDAIMMAPLVDLSEQDLEDLAAFYAAQEGLKDGPMDPEPSASMIGRDDSMPMFVSLLARAEEMARASELAISLRGKPSCSLKGDSNVDTDKDGLADAFDAVPNDADEFVSDINADGRYELCSIEQIQAILTLGTAPGTATGLALSVRMSRDYQLAQDIDASSIPNFQPIGDCGPPKNCMISLDKYAFQGTIDGRGHKISNLTISKPDQGGTSLIGVLGRTGVLLNMTIEDANIEGAGGVGGLVGSNFGVVYGAKVSGAIKGQNAVGGVVGGSAGLVVYSETDVTISGEKALGGVVGDMNGAVFYSSGKADVSGTWGLGGLVGLNTFGKILNSHSSGSISGETNTGGLVGINTDALLVNSYSSAEVTNTSQNAGGLVGFNSLSTILSSYASGKVFGVYAVGGLAGTNNGLVENAYATGPVSGNEAVGGLVGVRSQGAEIDSYWATDKTGQSKGAGDEDGPLTDPGTRFGPAPEASGFGVSNAKGVSFNELKALEATASGWMPEQGQSAHLLAYFCDQNVNGYIDFAERLPNNTLWSFEKNKTPSIKCKVGA